MENRGGADATGPGAPTVRLLGIAGSLRKGSFNRALLVAAAEVAPEEVELEIFDRMGEIPLYNRDVEREGTPPAVRALKEAMAAAGGLMIASPEYNYSISGVLKNALDWASRPFRDSPLDLKPAGIVGASGGGSGTMRSQLALRQVLGATGCPVLPRPELYLTRAREKFEDGRLADEDTRKRLSTFMAALAEWTRDHRARHRPG